MHHVHARPDIRTAAVVLCIAASSVGATAQTLAGQSLAPAPSASTPPKAVTPTPRLQTSNPADQAGPNLADRGTGVPTSMFGTYVRGGEWLIYPFLEHYRDNNFEYKPSEFGVAGEVDQRGRFRANEALLMVAYGLSDDVAVEIEAAVIDASLTRAATDTSSLPAKISESGLGDVEGQIRWRWRRETASRPELFSYTEVVVPHHREKLLIGTSGWELKFGTGLIRGFRWGTVTARAAVEYSSASSSHFDIGEYAVEYLKRLSPRWRVYLGVEGTQDEVSLIGELQWHVSPNVFAKFNSGFGLTSKATDWAPEVGIVFALPRR
jgi:hypothetical protein